MKITPSRLNNNNKKTQDSKKQPKKMTEPQQKIPNNNNNNENKPSIQVIGAGLGRTGTKSLQTALEILGYKTYHFPPPHHSGQWASLVDSLSPSSSSSSSPVTTPEMVLQMVADEGYTATCDQPMADLYFEQLTLFPDSKVVLTVRDTPEKWATSWRTLMNFVRLQEAPFSLLYPSPFLFFPFIRNWKRMRDIMGVHMGLEEGELLRGWMEKEEGWLERMYERHNALVKERVPEGRLLIFNVKEGWEPLCKFLGKEVPEGEFPFVNESKEIQNACRVMEIISYSWIPVLVSILGVAGRFLLKALLGI